MNIEYKIQFFTDWHCGSGMAAGADIDALVIKDKHGFPYIPGKTIKGLVREAVEDIISLQGEESKEMETLFVETFGYFDDQKAKETGSQESKAYRGDAFFSNAELPEDEKTAIIGDDLLPYLFRLFSSTAIGSDGLAIDHSLRRIETVVPAILYGKILNLPENKRFIDKITKAFHFIKRMGQNRNRGLGRCDFSVVKFENSPKTTLEDENV